MELFKEKTTINYLQLCNGTAVGLTDLLDARERRVQKQKEMLSLSTGNSLVSFTLNIAGPVKVFGLTKKAFEEGMEEIRCRLKMSEMEIVEEFMFKHHTGWEAFLLLRQDARKVKELLSEIEESHPIGRFFDIDVLDKTCKKISREEQGHMERKCLICGKSAFVCARSREHSVEELQKKTAEILFDYFAPKELETIADKAVKALIYEVNTTPKPGLVDRNNSGAHTDMDRGLFLKSAKALRPWFQNFVKIGMELSQNSDEEIFLALRKCGIRAEEAMFRVTKGVNTHKGLIFSMAIICGALGKHFVTGQEYAKESVSVSCASLAKYALLDFEQLGAKTPKTNGERLFEKYGIRGARLEAAEGFPTVLREGIPTLKNALYRGWSLNNASIAALISIMSQAIDTNIITRTNLQTAEMIRKEMEVLNWQLEKETDIEKVSILDQRFIAMGVSPGGAADLLAITLMFYFVCEDK